MKSKQRHELETNVLAKHLGVWIEKIRPYTSTIAGVLVAIVVVMFAWSWLTGQSSAKEEKAWQMFQSAVGTRLISGPILQESLEQLQRTSEEFAGTAAQQWANVAWADGQVFSASREILQNRESALETLNRAESAYQSVIASSQKEELVDRAHFGLARIYELRNDPDTAREYYLKVEGGFAALARERAEALAKEKTREALNWLAAVESTAVGGSAGTADQRPQFELDDLALPGSTGATTGGQTDLDLDTLLEGLEVRLNAATGEEQDRYAPGSEPAGDAGTTTEAETPAGQEATPASKDDAAMNESEAATTPADDVETPEEEEATASDDQTPDAETESAEGTAEPER